MPTLPAMLNLKGRRVVIVGGGAVAARRCAALLACGADVVVVAPHVKQYAARLVLATHPEGEFAAGGANGVTNRYIRCGASPRGAQALILASKVRALTEGRFHVSNDDLHAVAPACLRHRVLLNFEAEADRVDPDDIVREVLKLTPTQPIGMVKA